MPNVWQSFIPHCLTQELAQHPTSNPIGREQRFETVALFADVSGFTAMSEALGKAGRSGTEELTRVLNSYFEPMIALIHSYGGIIGKFGGDAMSVLFPCDRQNRTQAARQAIQCALDMQARMSDYAAIETSAGTFRLAMKAGLAAGPVLCTTVGVPSIRLEYVIAGSALEKSADAEHHAENGEVVIDASLAAMLDGLRVEQKNGFLAVKGMSHPPPKPTARTWPELPQAAIHTVKAYLHPAISQRIQEGLTSFVNEHRKVTVLFVRFDPLDYDNDPHAARKLQHYFKQVIEIVQSYDGYLNKIDIGDKGSKFIVLFGAPIAHEDDVNRALYCALDLQDIPDMPVHIGINTGFVFCGQVGSPLRQEYTVMGDAVNLAARLMQAAQRGQILMSETVYAENEEFTWTNLPSIQVKGKTEQVTIRHLKGQKDRRRLKLQAPEYKLPMVGRERELRIAQSKIERVLNGQGQVIGITAEAGMGKSRLSAEIIRLAIEQGLTPFGGECVSHGTNAPYLVWQNLLRGFFDLDPSWTSAEQISRLQSRLEEIDPNFLQRAPLLGLPLNLSIPENALTRSMDAGLRKASLEAMLVECVRHRARETPLLLVLENCHWIDPLSNDLLETIGRNVIDVPVMVLMMYRPPETEAIQPRGRNFSHFTEIRLTDFTQQEALRLIELKLKQLFENIERVPDEFIQRISERAQGNPFYIDEMLNLIHDQGIDPAEAGALEEVQLPESLHSLIISRIDQLSEGPKTTLKVASVIGRLFKAAWLWGIYPQLGAPDQVKNHLEHLHQLEITPLDKPEPELEYLFKHILTREVAYESLAVATRTMLHEQAGKYIERTYPHKLDQFLNQLAYHYGASDNQEKKREYFLKAGIAAQRAYANEAAIDYFQRLLPLLPQDEQPEIMLRMGQIWQLTGDWEKAEAIFRQALEIATKNQDGESRARCQAAIAGILIRRGAYQEASEWLAQAKAYYESLDVRHGLDETLRELGVLHWYQGNYDQALANFEASQKFAKLTGNQKAAYRALGNIGLIYKIRGDYQRALWCYRLAQEVAKELADRQGESIILGNVGNVYLEEGDYSQALNYYAKSLQLSLEIGDRQGISISVGNMGKIYWYTGDFASSLACNAFNLQIAIELGDRLNAAIAASTTAMVYMEQGQFDKAAQLLERAVALGRVLDAPYELADFLFNKANLMNAQGRPRQALSALDEAIRLAAEVGNGATQFEAEVTRIRTRARTQAIDTNTAILELETLLETWKDHRRDEEEEAAISYEIWKLDPSRTNCREKAVQLYQHLYEHTPSNEYRSRYQELTGEPLPDPPPLPPLPDIVAQKPIHLSNLLAQLDALIQEAEKERSV